MRLRNLHPWKVGVEQAREIQTALASQVVCESRLPPQVRRVAGLDLSPRLPDGTVRGAVVVVDHPSLEPVEVRVSRARESFPYIPGFLSFREVPPLIGALEALEEEPDILICDGQGLAHPRRFGLACHVGLITDRPTIGCAKSLLVGSHGPLPDEVGATAPIVDGDEVVGMALRTRKGARPVYVSIGHKISLEDAVQWVLACCDGHRLPVTTRLAHDAAAGRIPPGHRHPPPTQGTLL